MTRRAAVFVVALVAAALVGVGLLVVPGSPLEERPTLGLDLQGGLEVTLQAVPPRDRELTEEDLDRSVEIMRDRVDRLGVAEPEIRTQGDDQISIQLPGVKDPAAAAAIIGKTAQLELFDLEKNLVAPSIDARSRQPIATAKLYDLLAGQQALAAPRRARHVLRLPAEGQEARPWAGRDASRPRSRNGTASCPQVTSSSPCRPRRSSSSVAPGEVVCPGVAELEPTTNSYYLLRFTPPDVPEMTGEDLDLEGTRQDFDTTTGEPIVLMDFTDDGADTFEEITRDVAQRGQAPLQHGRRRPGRLPQLPPALRDRARPRDQVVADDRLRGVPGRHLGLERRADLGPRRRGGGEGPGARAADGCAPGRVPYPRSDRDLGDAREGLARGGEDRSARRPPRGRVLPARLLPLPRSRRRRRPDRLRRRSSTRRSSSSTSPSPSRASPGSC